MVSLFALLLLLVGLVCSISCGPASADESAAEAVTALALGRLLPFVLISMYPVVSLLLSSAKAATLLHIMGVGVGLYYRICLSSCYTAAEMLFECTVSNYAG